MTQFVSSAGRRWALLLVLLMLAFSLRVFQLERHDIWGDEAWSITVANWPLSEIVTSDAETNPPLYHVILHFAIRVFGETPWGIRYLSVIAGVLIVALLIRLGQEVGGPRLGTWSGVAATLSPVLVHHAQEARMYGVAVAGTSASLLVLVMLMSRQEAGQRVPGLLWIAYGSTSLIGMYSHYYVFAVLLTQAAVVTASCLYRRSWRSLLPWFAAWIGMALLFLPWLLIHARFLGGKAYARFDELTLTTLGSIGRRTLLALGGGTTLFPEQGPWGWAVSVVAVLGLAGMVFSLRRPRAALLFTGVLGGGLLFAWGVNPIMPFFQARYLLVVLPAFLLAVGAGVESLYRAWRPLALPAVALLVGVAYVSLGNYYFDPAFAKGEYGLLMQDLRQRGRPDDLILLNNPLQGSLYDYYGPEDLAFTMVPRERLLGEEQAARLLSELTAGERRVWLVETGNPAEYDPQQRVRGWLSRHGSQGFFRSYRGATLALYILGGASEVEVPTSANLDDKLLLVGYNLEVGTVRAGDPLLLTLFWQAQRSLTQDYTVFTHLVDAEGRIRAQMDSQPVGGTRPTSTWQPEETVADNYALLVPRHLPAGVYRVQVGAYVWPELNRLPLLDESGHAVDDKIVLQEVTVEG